MIFFLQPELYNSTQRQKNESFTVDYCLLNQECPPLAYKGSMVQEKLQTKMVELAEKYNQKSMDTLICLFGDGLSLFVFFQLLILQDPKCFY